VVVVGDYYVSIIVVLVAEGVVYGITSVFVLDISVDPVTDVI